MKNSSKGNGLRFLINQKQKLSVGLRIAIGVSFVVLFTAISFLIIHLSSTEKSSAGVATITFVSSASNSVTGSKNLTWNHTVASGTDQVLVVGVTTSSQPVTAVTYNGTAMTAAGSISKNGMRVYMYYMFNPATGTKQVKVTTAVNTNLYAGSSLISGVSNTTPFTVTTNSGTSSAPSTGVVTTVDGYTVLTVLGSKNRNPTPTSPLSQVYELGSNFNHYNNMSSRAGASPSVVGDFALSSSDDWGVVTTSLIPATTLPVKWKNFEVRIEKQKVVADWTTASEINNDHFVLEKSTDGLNFTTVTVVRGSGNATYDNYYSATDENGATTLTYYRVKQVDYDGKSDYTDVRAVNPNFALKEMVIYPTMVFDHMRVQYLSGQNEGTVQYKILDYQGRPVASGNVELSELSGSWQVGLETLQKGNYVFILENNGQILGRKKFVKID